MLADPQGGQDALARLRRPVARHREHGRGHQGHAVHQLDAGVAAGAAHRDADDLQPVGARPTTPTSRRCSPRRRRTSTRDLASFYNTGAPGTTLGTPLYEDAVGTAANAAHGDPDRRRACWRMHAHTSLPSPTKRGRLVRQQILCEAGPGPARGRSTASRSRRRPRRSPTGRPRATSTCSTSAATNQPATTATSTWTLIGFGFDNYDATGAYITPGERHRTSTRAACSCRCATGDITRHLHRTRPT